MSYKKNLNVGILTFPIGDAGTIPLSNLIKIFSAITNEIYLITGNSGNKLFNNEKCTLHTYGVFHKKGSNMLTIPFRYIYTQVKLARTLLIASNKVDFWIFFLNSEVLLIPMIAAKLLRKKVILSPGGSLLKVSKCRSSNFSKALEYSQNINRILSDRIILYSHNLISEWNLEKHKDKILIADPHFIDFDKFKLIKNFSQRDNAIGYIGAFADEKGALNYVKAIPLVLKEKGNIKFLLIGDGPQRECINQYIKHEKLSENVVSSKWIPHDKVANCLTELKLLILPSFTEGLPNIMLESMACGTPVLATSVGAIGDVIKEGHTGFIMNGNTPRVHC